MASDPCLRVVQATHPRGLDRAVARTGGCHTKEVFRGTLGEIPVLALLTLTVGCGALARTAASPFQPQPTRASTLVTDLAVEVRNEHWRPMRVWVEWPGMRRFLGDVAPGSAVTLSVPAELCRTRGPLRFRADPTGSVDEFLSDPIDVGKGRRVEWRIRKVMANSRVRVM